MLRVAILSAWHVHANGYAQEFANYPDVTLTAMWDDNPDRGAAFAEKWNIPYEHNLDALLARKDVDAVCINAATNIHREVLVKAAKAEKHIFTEKVLAATNAEARRIREAVLASGIKFCISYPHRCMPQNLYAKKIMDEGLLGDITLMRVRNAHNGTSKNWLPAHFYDIVSCCGGAMMDLGAHPMYLVRWLMGKPKTMQSTFTNVYGKPVEENAVCVMAYDNGAIAISETSFVSERGSPFSLELYGTEGTLMVGSNQAFLSTTKETAYEGKVEEYPEALPGPIPMFIAGVTKDEPIIFDIEEAVALTEMMDAAYSSHKQGKKVLL